MRSKRWNVSLKGIDRGGKRTWMALDSNGMETGLTCSRDDEAGDELILGCLQCLLAAGAAIAAGVHHKVHLMSTCIHLQTRHKLDKSRGIQLMMK